MSKTESIYDNPSFIQPGLFGGETRFYKFENNLGAMVRISGQDVSFQPIRFPGGGDAWQLTVLQNLKGQSVHGTQYLEPLLEQVRDFPWGA